MVVFDTSVLLLLLHPGARAPVDPATSLPVDRAQARIEHLVSELSQGRKKIVIPTPVLSELLVHAGEATNQYLDQLNNSSAFRIANFDQKAAIEVAVAMKDAIIRGGLRVDSTDPNATRGKVKFDRQIVAIAKAEGATAIYSDDSDIIKYARQAGLNTRQTFELDMPPMDAQGEFEI